MDEHLAFARKSSLREYAESIGVAVAIALLLRAFVVEAFQIPSGSMIPTLEVGDHIFVSKFSYGIGIPFTYKKLFQFGQPRRGDIIVFRYPADPEVDYIKRVVALPGEKIEVRKNEIFIDGKLMPRENVKGPCSYEDGPANQGMEKQVRAVARAAERAPARRLSGPEFFSQPVRPFSGAGRTRVRDGRQPGQLQRFAGVGDGSPGADQGPGPHRVVVTRAHGGRAVGAAGEGLVRGDPVEPVLQPGSLAAARPPSPHAP